MAGRRSSGQTMGVRVVVSGVVGSIDLVDLVRLVASVGVVLACHGSGGRADGLRWIAARARAARTVEV